MIVGGYSLDLYCDAFNPRGPCVNHFLTGSSTILDRFNPRRGEFIGASGQTCERQAKKAGWVMDKRTGVAICPPCARAGRVVIASVSTGGE